jgi:N utilization substance protein B
VTARRKARKRALDILFEAEQRAVPALDLLANRKTESERDEDYATTLVEGVEAHRSTIDELIAANLAGEWTLTRLPAVDRAALRIGVFELRFGDEIPSAVAVSEAVGLVADLSTDESPNYVNGVLSAIAATVPAQNVLESAPAES